MPNSELAGRLGPYGLIGPKGFEIFVDTAVTLQVLDPAIFSGILRDRDGNPAFDDRIRLLSSAIETGRIDLARRLARLGPRVLQGRDSAW